MIKILYSYRRCPYAIRARMALAAAQIVYEHREVDLANKPAHMLQISPKGTVPVLLLEDGSVLEQSLDIMDYALLINDPYGWLQFADNAKKWIVNNDNEFKQMLNGYKYPERYPEKSREQYQEMILTYLLTIEAALTPFIDGRKMTMVDIAIFPFIRQCAKIDEVWFASQPLPKLQMWLANITALSLFDTVMLKHQLWQE